MGYQVLARKYRPRTFNELVGQEHVARALIHALDHDRLHHAYLFTGTRGVGKTTIARILSRCLNCEQGVSSNPCGVCASCKEINEGRFVDLIEVDAASRTKVEDTRELLDNVQYAPTRGRYKVYLIDEVHMLSTHSFNALLKTLEEPPPHVKFLLATTDPQKLPVTILSRCLQFNLKALPAGRIAQHLKSLLDQEGSVRYEEGALHELGEAAQGSMRDALSLTDQAIAFSGGTLNEADVRQMLGTVDRDQVRALLVALAEGQAVALLDAVDNIADQAPDYLSLLDGVIAGLHRIAVAQVVPEREQDDTTRSLAASMTGEAVQLYYDIAVRSRRDLNEVPDPRLGLEMILLRMVSFRPQGQLPAALTPAGGAANPAKKPSSTGPTPAEKVKGGKEEENHAAPSAEASLEAMRMLLEDQPATAKRAAVQPEPVSPAHAAGDSRPQTEKKPANLPSAGAPSPGAASPVEPLSRAKNTVPQGAGEAEPGNSAIAAPTRPNLPPKPLTEPPVTDRTRWWAWLVSMLELDSGARNLARQCVLKEKGDTTWTLLLRPDRELMRNPERLKSLEQALCNHVKRTVRIDVLLEETPELSPDDLAEQLRQQAQERAKVEFQQDTVVRALCDELGATVDLQSVEPLHYEEI